MQGKSRLGMLILMLVLMARGRGVAQAEQPGRRVAAEAISQDRPAEPGQPSGGKRKRATQPGRTTAPPRPKSKERRRPPAALAVPEDIEEEEAEEGFSLDEVVARLLAVNRNLAVKYQDIPKARADILSAGLIENPSVFLDSEGVPYGNYSRQRPGETSYGPTVAQPFDVNGKRGARIRVARRAEKVVEALYQDAARQEIDKLYSVYVDVLESRHKRNALRRSVADLAGVAEATRALAGRGVRPRSDAAEAALRRANTDIALREAEANLMQAQRELALLLAVPAPHADRLAVRGSLRDQAPPPPSADELVQLALQSRPDLAAFQLSVARARAAVQLSRAERFEDVLGFYTPYQAVTFPSQGRQTASSWEIGGLAVLPVFDRNQGDIAKGRAEVDQLQIQWQGLRNQVIYEVQHAATEYAVSRRLVQKYENDLLSRARQIRDEKHLLFLAGQEDLDAFLAAAQSYAEVVNRYLEALVSHRRAMLRLNTVVGLRLLP